jgi:archaellin
MARQSINPKGISPKIIVIAVLLTATLLATIIYSQGFITQNKNSNLQTQVSINDEDLREVLSRYYADKIFYYFSYDEYVNVTLTISSTITFTTSPTPEEVEILRQRYVNLDTSNPRVAKWVEMITKYLDPEYLISIIEKQGGKVIRLSEVPDSLDQMQFAKVTYFIFGAEWVKSNLNNVKLHNFLRQLFAKNDAVWYGKIIGNSAQWRWYQLLYVTKLGIYEDPYMRWKYRHWAEEGLFVHKFFGILSFTTYLGMSEIPNTLAIAYESQIYEEDDPMSHIIRGVKSAIRELGGFYEGIEIFLGNET